MVEEITSKETTNIILKLTQEGWDANQMLLSYARKCSESLKAVLRVKKEQIESFRKEKPRKYQIYGVSQGLNAEDGT